MALSPSTHLLTPALPPQKIPLACTPTGAQPARCHRQADPAGCQRPESRFDPVDVPEGLEVGQLTKLTLNAGGSVTGEMTVDPSVVDLLREKTRIELRNPKLSLSDASISSLLTGSTFELIPGEGAPNKNFVIAPADKALLQKPGVLTVTLNAPESYGIEAGQPLILHGVQVGRVLERKLTEKGVSFSAAIDPQYSNLVHGDSKFVVNSRVDVKVGLDGVEFLGASASEWVNGGIRILPGSKGALRESYPLFANLDKAIENSLGDLPTTTLTLSAETLPDVRGRLRRALS